MSQAKESGSKRRDYGLRDCDQCGREFTAYRHNARFCSETCKNRHHYLRRNQIRIIYQLPVDDDGLKEYFMKWMEEFQHGKITIQHANLFIRDVNIYLKEKKK